jgi:perosamine synthetase
VARLRLHGLDRQAWDRFRVSKSWDYDIAEPGYKYNLTDMASALGLGQLTRADESWKKRQRLAEFYRERLASVPGVEPLAMLPDRKHAWHIFVVQLDSAVLGVDRDDVIDRLNDAGIGTSVHYRPLHLHSYYRNAMGYRSEDLPVSSAAFERIVSLPFYPGLDQARAAEVVETLASLTS